MQSRTIVRRMLIVAVGTTASILLYVFAPVDSLCPVDIHLYQLLGFGVAHCAIVAGQCLKQTMGVDPLALPQGELYPNEWAWRTRHPTRDASEKETIIFQTLGLKYILLFCLSAMGFNFLWLMGVTTTRCNLDWRVSTVYWVTTSCAALASVVFLLYLSRQACNDLSSYRRFRQMTAISSEYKSLRVLWQHLLDPAQVLSQKIGLMSHIPWGSDTALKLHLELIRKAFSWRVISSEELLLKDRVICCGICEERILAQELVVMFPLFHLTLNEQNKKPEQTHAAILKKLRKIQRQGILEVVCPQPSGELLEYLDNNQVIWRDPKRPKLNICRLQNFTYSRITEYQMLHEGCLLSNGYSSGNRTADRLKIRPTFYRPVLGWAKQRLEELNLNHAVKRDIPRFYGMLPSPPETKTHHIHST